MATESSTTDLILSNDPIDACLFVISGNGNNTNSLKSIMLPAVYVDASLCGTPTIEVVVNGVKRVITLPNVQSEGGHLSPTASIPFTTAAMHVSLVSHELSRVQSAETLQPGVMSPEMAALCAVADSSGYDVVDVPGDGDCVFAAMSITLMQYGKNYGKDELRRILAEYIRDHPCVDDNMSVWRKDFIDTQYLRLDEPISDRDLAWNMYIDRIGLPFRDGGIWGDEIALQGLSEVLDLNITIFYHDGSHVQQYGQARGTEVGLGFVSYDDVKGPGDERRDRFGQHFCALVKRRTVPSLTGSDDQRAERRRELARLRQQKRRALMTDEKRCEVREHKNDQARWKRRNESREQAAIKKEMVPIDTRRRRMANAEKQQRAAHKKSSGSVASTVANCER